MAGESVDGLVGDENIRLGVFKSYHIEAIIREGATGKFDPLPMKQARVYAAATGAKVGRMVRV